jgi:hypothetical protein
LVILKLGASILIVKNEKNQNIGQFPIKSQITARKPLHFCSIDVALTTV